MKPRNGPFVDEKLKKDPRVQRARALGPDPLGERYAERRAGYSLFAPMMSDADIEALRAVHLLLTASCRPATRLTVATTSPASGGRPHPASTPP